MAASFAHEAESITIDHMHDSNLWPNYRRLLCASHIRKTDVLLLISTKCSRLIQHIEEALMTKEIDWVFLNADGGKDEATLPGAAPNAGDGKSYKNRGYVVRYVVSARITSLNDIVIATEHKQR